MSNPPSIERTLNITIGNKDGIRSTCLELASRLARRTMTDSNAPRAGLLRGPCLNPDAGFPPAGTPMVGSQPRLEVGRITIRQGNDGQENIHLVVRALGNSTPTYELPDYSQNVRIENAAKEFNKAFDDACKKSPTQLRLETKALQSPSLPNEEKRDSTSAHNSMAGVFGIVTFGPSFITPFCLTEKHGAINWQLTGSPAIYVVINSGSTEKFKKELSELTRTVKSMGTRKETPIIIPSLSFLESKKIGFHMMIQEKGDIIVYLPGTYYYGFNTAARYGEFLFYRFSQTLMDEGQDDIIPDALPTSGHSPYSAQDLERELGETPATEHLSWEEVMQAFESTDSVRRDWAQTIHTAWPHIKPLSAGLGESEHLSWDEVMQAFESTDNTRRDWARVIHTAWPYIKPLPAGLGGSLNLG